MMEYLDLLPDENDLKGKTIEEQNKILEDTLQLFIDNVELNALHRSHSDPEGVGLRELLKKNPQWEIELTTRPVKMFFTKWVKEIDEAVGYQRAEKIETVISIYEGLLVNECINKAAEYLRLKQIPEVEKCIDHFKEVLKTHHINESTRKLTNPDQKAMSDNTFLNAMDYAAIAKEYLLLVPDLRFNYLEAIRKKYHRANDNMFELIANEIGKIKAWHLDRLSSNIFRMLQMGVELDFESELERVKEQSWMPAIQGGYSVNSLDELEQGVRKYAELMENQKWIEKNRIEWPELLARTYRVTAVDKAIQSVEEIINEQRGRLGKEQFAQSDLIEPLKGLIVFWESELVFHKGRKKTKASTKKEEHSFDEYLINHGRKLMPFIKTNYINSKPTVIVPLLFALSDCDCLKFKMPAKGKVKSIHAALTNLLGEIGTREALTSSIKKHHERSDQLLESRIKNVKKSLNKYIADIQ